MVEKYQGKEVTVILQANTEKELQRMLDGVRDYARKQRLGDVDLLTFSRDPDGGWKALVEAHNWNPLSWVKEKFSRGSPEESTPISSARRLTSSRIEWEEEPIEGEFRTIDEQEDEEAKKKRREEEFYRRWREQQQEIEEIEKLKGAEWLQKREQEELRLRREREEMERMEVASPYVQKTDVAAEKYRLRRMGETRAQRTARVGKGVSSVSGALFKVATLGGPPKGAGKSMRELYVPTGMRRMTAPESYRGMRQLTMMGGPKEIAAGRAMTPQYGGLRQLTMPSGLATSRIGATARQTLPMRQATRLTASPMVNETAMARLRSLSVPRNLTQSEQLAYAEIRANRDIDTRSHVVDELAKLGVSKAEAGKAVDGLLRKGMVRKDRTFNGEPILEIAR